MTNIYFWGKIISPTFNQLKSNQTSTILSLHTDQIIKHVSCGTENAFLLTDNHQLYAFGSNQDGQLGLTFNPHKHIELSKIFVPTKTKIVSISCGWHHTLILDQLGCLFSSGRGSQGATGQNTKQNCYGFKNIMNNVRKISAGLDHSLAIKGNKVFGWGNTQDGQLGLHSKKKILSPKQLNVYPSQQIFAGPKYSIFVTVKGVYGCGMNNNFQLGLGHDKDIHYPKHLNINDQIIKICGGNYCFAKNKAGNVYIWGTGAFGAFKFPTKIQFFENCDNLSLGLNFGIVEKNQRIYVWGSNNFGQLGTDCSQIKDYAFECSKLTKLDLAAFTCGGNFTVGISYGQEDKFQNQMQTEYTKDQIKQDFYGSQDLQNIGKNNNFKQSLQSFYGSSSKMRQNANIFKQSVRSRQNNNFITSSMNEQRKNNHHQISSSNSQKQKSNSDQTVKKMIPIGCSDKNNRQKGDKVNLQQNNYYEVNKMCEQLSQLKIQIEQKSKRNHFLNEQNSYLKDVIKKSMLNENSPLKYQEQSLIQEYHSINNLVKNNQYLRNLLGMQQQDSQIIQNQSNVQDIQQFGQKLYKLKTILEQVVKNNQSARSSLA